MIQGFFLIELFTFITPQDSISVLEVMLIGSMCWSPSEWLVGRVLFLSSKFGQICEFQMGILNKTWVLSLCVHSYERWPFRNWQLAVCFH